MHYWGFKKGVEGFCSLFENIGRCGCRGVLRKVITKKKTFFFVLLSYLFESSEFFSPSASKNLKNG